MAARVIHYGPDDCHRRMVLQSAGYCVEECNSLGQLRASLMNGSAIDAVLVGDAEGASAEEAIAVARTHCSLPVILFRSTNLAYQDVGADLVVQCLTPPEVWLDSVDSLIERTRTTLRA